MDELTERIKAAAKRIENARGWYERKVAREEWIRLLNERALNSSPSPEVDKGNQGTLPLDL